MLPAFGYPELRKHKNLVGNFGGAWYDQCKDFRDFPGPILLTSNCLIQPQPSYKKRLFTEHIVSWDGIPHLKDGEFGPLIDSAVSNSGFKKSQLGFRKHAKESETCGYGHDGMKKLLVDPIQKGYIKHIYLIGGCDNLDPSRDFNR
jgi:hydroxylamine reductase